MTKRERIFNKYNGLCAYSGTPLDPDWQIDHIKPVVRNWFDRTMIFKDNDYEKNMVPVQKIINHYKGSLDLETFRGWFMSGLHRRLAKLPKNPRTEKSKKKIIYMRKVASYFNISEDKPFSGKFYFETITNN